MTATASGAQVPDFPQINPVQTPEAFTSTAAQTLTVSDKFKIKTNLSLANTVTITLPAAAAAAGCVIRFAALAAQAMRVAPASGESVYLHGSGVADKYAQLANAIGNYMDLYSDGENWIVARYSGVVTKQS